MCLICVFLRISISHYHLFFNIVCFHPRVVLIKLSPQPSQAFSIVSCPHHPSLPLHFITRRCNFGLLLSSSSSSCSCFLHQCLDQKVSFVAFTPGWHFAKSSQSNRPFSLPLSFKYFSVPTSKSFPITRIRCQLHHSSPSSPPDFFCTMEFQSCVCVSPVRSLLRSPPHVLLSQPWIASTNSFVQLQQSLVCNRQA